MKKVFLRVIALGVLIGMLLFGACDDNEYSCSSCGETTYSYVELFGASTSSTSGCSPKLKFSGGRGTKKALEKNYVDGSVAVTYTKSQKALWQKINKRIKSNRKKRQGIRRKCRIHCIKWR